MVRISHTVIKVRVRVKVRIRICKRMENDGRHTQKQKEK